MKPSKLRAALTELAALADSSQAPRAMALADAIEGIALEDEALVPGEIAFVVVQSRPKRDTPKLCKTDQQFYLMREDAEARHAEIPEGLERDCMQVREVEVRFTGQSAKDEAIRQAHWEAGEAARAVARADYQRQAETVVELLKTLDPATAADAVRFMATFITPKDPP